MKNIMVLMVIVLGGFFSVLKAQNNLKPAKNVKKETVQDFPQKDTAPAVIFKTQLKDMQMEGLKFITPPMMDVDGNIYPTVMIGAQVWMQENLRTTRFKNGSSIELVTNANEWKNNHHPGYSWYDNDIGTYRNSNYGALYNWYTVNTRNLCPDGWRVPTLKDNETLILYLGGSPVAGGKLKEEGTAHWKSPNQSADNQSGFSALPAGHRTTDGSFEALGAWAPWWTLTEFSDNESYYGLVTYGNGLANNKAMDKTAGMPVRCIQGQEPMGNIIRIDSLPTVTDVEGNVYHTVMIGSQAWMVENLKTTKLNDGKSMVEFDQYTNYWCSDPKKAAYIWYNYDVTNKQRYGALYNWYSVSSNKLCPVGWHVPDKDEFKTLESFLLGENVAGAKLKEKGTSHWKSPNHGATNEVGFSALPGGYMENGEFRYVGYNGMWWTSSVSSSFSAYYLKLFSELMSTNVSAGDKRNGYSVRCVKD